MLRSGWNEHSISKFNEVNARLTELMVQDDTYWRQRSKTLWLKDGGDFNMKLFHASTTTRRKRNHIDKLLKDDGIEVTSQEDIKEVVAYYFRHIFNGQVGLYEPVTNSVQSCISEEDNRSFGSPFYKGII